MQKSTFDENFMSYIIFYKAIFNFLPFIKELTYRYIYIQIYSIKNNKEKTIIYKKRLNIIFLS